VSKPAGTKLSFEEWKAVNQSGTFKQWYVHSVLDAAVGNRKKPHATLGPNLKPGSLERAADIAKLVIEFGVNTTDTVIDYGCGTLRIGRFLIEYLDPQKFVGLDIDQRIVDQGVAMLPPALVREKQPTVDVIGEETITRIAARHPRWIYASGVIHHVPPEDLNELFENIHRLSDAETTSLIWTKGGEDETLKLSTRSWFHSNEGLLELTSSIGFSAELVSDTLARKDIKILVLKRHS
jgi:SAM-dependent methyltransferase